MPGKALLITLRTRMWFIPMLMVTGAILLVYGCIRVDDASTADFARYYAQLLAGRADSIRMMLSAIAISMITVSGIIFFCKSSKRLSIVTAQTRVPAAHLSIASNFNRLLDTSLQGGTSWVACKSWDI